MQLRSLSVFLNQSHGSSCEVNLSAKQKIRIRSEVQHNMQAFHTLYHTDENILLGAPTGSGKTISAELAMLRVFRQYPGMKTIYIAPLKVLC